MRAGGGCANRMAVAPGAPWNGRGKSPQPASNNKRRRNLNKETTHHGRQDQQEQKLNEIRHQFANMIADI